MLYICDTYIMKYYINRNGSKNHQIKDSNSFCREEYEKENNRIEKRAFIIAVIFFLLKKP